MFKFGRHVMFLRDEASDQAAAAAAATAAGTGGGTNGNGTGANAGKTYTQEELNAMFGARAQQAKSAAETALLAELGVPDIAAAKTRLQAARDAEAAQQTDLQKAQKAAEDAKKRADDADAARTAALARADEKLLRAAVMSVATAQGVDDGELKTLWLLLKDDGGLRGKIKAKADSDDEFDGVDEVVKEMVKAHPKWLKTATEHSDINARNRGGDPSDAALKAASDAQGKQLRNRF
jgi:hypothetical protein